MSAIFVFTLLCLAITRSASAGLIIAAAFTASATVGQLAGKLLPGGDENFWSFPFSVAIAMVTLFAILILSVVFFSRKESQPRGYDWHSNW